MAEFNHGGRTGKLRLSAKTECGRSSMVVSAARGYKPATHFCAPVGVLVSVGGVDRVESRSPRAGRHVRISRFASRQDRAARILEKRPAPTAGIVVHGGRKRGAHDDDPNARYDAGARRCGRLRASKRARIRLEKRLSRALRFRGHTRLFAFAPGSYSAASAAALRAAVVIQPEAMKGLGSGSERLVSPRIWKAPEAARGNPARGRGCLEAEDVGLVLLGTDEAADDRLRELAPMVATRRRTAARPVERPQCLTPRGGPSTRSRTRDARRAGRRAAPRRTRSPSDVVQDVVPHLWPKTKSVCGIVALAIVVSHHDALGGAGGRFTYALIELYFELAFISNIARARSLSRTHGHLADFLRELGMLRRQRLELEEERVDTSGVTKNQEDQDRQECEPEHKPPAPRALAQDGIKEPHERESRRRGRRGAPSAVPEPRAPALDRLAVETRKMVAVCGRRKLQHRCVISSKRHEDGRLPEAVCESASARSRKRGARRERIDQDEDEHAPREAAKWRPYRARAYAMALARVLGGEVKVVEAEVEGATEAVGPGAGGVCAERVTGRGEDAERQETLQHQFPSPPPGERAGEGASADNASCCGSDRESSPSPVPLRGERGAG